MSRPKTVGVRSFAKKALQASILIGASTLAMGATSQAFAQQSGEQDSTITVTGDRRDPQSPRYTAPLEDTPRSITVIPPEVLEATAAATLTDALRTIPGITLGSGEGGTGAGDRPFIRGIDSTNDVFVDGVRDSGVTSREVFNLEQVEVSRGPGGAFAGRGSTGGSLNLVSKTPHVSESFYAGSVALGSDETRRATLDINQVLGDHAAFRLNIMDHEADVAGRDAVHLSRQGIAPSLALGLGTPTRITLSYYHLENDDVPDYGIPYEVVGTATDPVYGAITYRAPISGHDEDFYGLLNRDFREQQADIGTLRVEYDFSDNITLRNVTRYGETSNHQVVTNPDDSRGNVANGYIFRSSKNRGLDLTTTANVTDLYGEFQALGWTHNFDIGMELSREETHNQGYYVVAPNLAVQPGFPPTSGAPGAGTNVSTGTACSNLANQGAAGGYNCTTLSNPNPNDPWNGQVVRSRAYTDTTTEVFALYAFDTIEFNEQWSLNLGLRYDEYATEQTGVTAAASAAAPYYTLGVATPLEREDSFVNYQIGLVYNPTEAGTIYFNVGTSTNPSGEGGGDTSSLSTAIQILEPEENLSYEAGVKWQLFGERALATAAIFHTEKTNARVTDAFGVTDTVGTQEVNGIELTLSGQITEDWFVFGGYTYLDSELVDAGFQSITNATVCAPVTTCFVQSAATGKRFPNTPEHALSLWSTYSVTDAFTFGAGASYMSDRFADTTNRISIPEYWRYDANASYAFNDHVNVQLNLYNLSDERYVTNPFTTHMAQIAPGRSALLTLNVRY
ncbi:MAG: TonB-dependent receptor [Caulobacterales bacterium]|nr:TonB-dependent receptor [Caulobacterales bacterium]